MVLEDTYQVAHEGRARLFGLGIAGGCNAYWDAATLKVGQALVSPFLPDTSTAPLSFGAVQEGSQSVVYPHVCTTPLHGPAVAIILSNKPDTTSF